MTRSIVVIVAGFFFIGLLCFGADAVLRTVAPGAFSPSGGTDNVPVLLTTLVYVLAFAVTGCYLTARFAPHSPVKHALVLGVLGLVFNVAGAIGMWETAPAWYHVVSVLTTMPAAWLGGRLREAQLQQPRTA